MPKPRKPGLVLTACVIGAVILTLICALIGGDLWSGEGGEESVYAEIETETLTTLAIAGEDPAPAGHQDQNQNQDTDMEIVKAPDESPETSEIPDRQETIPSGAPDAADLAEGILPSIVSVTSGDLETAEKISHMEEESQEAQAFMETLRGSGILIREDEDFLYLVTDSSVVSSVEDITVGFSALPGSSDDRVSLAEGELLGSDEETGLSLLSVWKEDLPRELREERKPAVLGDSDRIRIGQKVFAIGDVLGIGPSASEGIVSISKRRMSAGSYIQTDAYISGENIGGALLDLSGQVIGINAGSASAGTLMMGFALPINSAKESISRMLGEVLISETEAETETEAGVLSETEKEKEKEKEKETAALPEAFSETEAELQTESRRETEGRVQLHISGQNPEGAVSETEKLSPATEKALSETEESERQKEAPALIETEGLSAPKELPEATKTRGLLGIHGAAISEEYQIVNRMPAGIYVTEVDPGSGAQMAGILNEDVITAIDGVQVTSIEELRGALDGTKAGDIVSVTIIRADDHEKYTVEKTVRVTLQ